MRRVVPCVALIGLGLGLSSAVGAHAAQESTPAVQTYKGLEISVAGLERASSAALNDCPAGANSQRAMSRPGEGFAIVTVKMKVLPNFESARLGRPVLTDSAGNLYYTAASFVDVGKVPEFSCAFPFRIPDDTEPRSIQIDEVSFDLTSLDAQ